MEYSEERRRGAGNLFLTLIIVGGILLAFFVVVCIFRDGMLDTAAQQGYVEAQAAVKDDSGISFTALEDEGTDSKDWITVPGTTIDYPLVQGTDNAYYLTHDAFGNESRAGAVFINYLNAKDFSDNKTIIFGHNMADGSMFSDLNKYGDEAWGREHSTLTIQSADGSKREYSLLCYLYTSPSNDNVYVTNPDEPVTETASKLLGDAKVVYKDFSGGSLVCLSTCKHHSSRSVAVFELANYTPGIVTGEQAGMRWGNGVSPDEAVGDSADGAQDIERSQTVTPMEGE